MSGSYASNLGYGNIRPGSDINPRYVNVSNTHNQGNFGSRVIPGMPKLPGLTGAQWNVDAAKGYVPGIAVWKGGLKKKIKNITKMYKMKDGKKRMRTMKRRFKRHVHKHSCFNNSCKRRHRNSINKRGNKSQRGGYAQYQNNLPITGVYSLGGVLPADKLGLANPPPYQPLSNCANCMDNYNHYLGHGFPSKGH